MDKISTCRAAYLAPFIDILRDVGAPVDRELALAKLPVMIEEAPDEFVSNILADEFVARGEAREGIDDLGWLWASQFSSSTFSDELLTALQSLPTVKARLARFASLSKLEDSDVRVGVLTSDGRAEVFCDISPPEGISGIHISEWTQVTVLIEVIRIITGKSWSPDEIRFKSDFSVCDAAREANPNTRFLRRSAHTSIVMPSSLLASSKMACAMTPSRQPDMSVNPDGTDGLKRLLRPYLRTAAPRIDLLAEIVGTSARSLQRKLNQAGSSYSELIETTRFEMATEMLGDPDARLVDVAMTLGYENQSNFGRSFRRIAGISPGRYRRERLDRNRAAGFGAI